MAGRCDESPDIKCCVPDLNFHQCQLAVPNTWTMEGGFCVEKKNGWVSNKEGCGDDMPISPIIGHYAVGSCGQPYPQNMTCKGCIPQCNDIGCKRIGGQCSFFNVTEEISRQENLPLLNCTINTGLCSKNFLSSREGPCWCCTEVKTDPPVDNSCKDVNDQCKRRMQGLGECVNATSVDDWSILSIKYDLWGDSYSNQFCQPADGSLKKDCCRCMKRRPCRDGGCYENGGKCVDMKKAHIYLSYYGVTHHHGVASRSLLGRSFAPFFTTENGQVDLSNRIDGDGLCQSENPKRSSCCECYQRVSNITSGNFNLFKLFTQLRTYGTLCLRSN